MARTSLMRAGLSAMTIVSATLAGTPHPSASAQTVTMEKVPTSTKLKAAAGADPVRVATAAANPCSTAALSTESTGRLTKFGATGARDLSFGAPSTVVWADGLVLDAANRIIEVGTSPATTSCTRRLVVARYSSSGALDLSFGGRGWVALPAAAATRVTGFGNVAIDKAGRIVVLGVSSETSGVSPKLLMARLLPDGALDTSFGGTGVVERDVPGVPNPSQLTLGLAADNAIVVGGKFSVACPAPSIKDKPFVAKFLENGTIDASFGSGGARVIDRCGRSYSPARVLVDKNARAYLVVTDFMPNKVLAGENYRQGVGLFVWRMTANGTLDASFGSSGLFELKDPSYIDKAAFDAFLQEPSIVVAGRLALNGAGNELLLFRLGSNGQLDTTFGQGGVARTKLPTGVSARLHFVVPDSKNRILGLGHYRTGAGQNIWGQTFWARFTPTGALDTSVGTNGITEFKGHAPSAFAGTPAGITVMEGAP